MRETEYLTAILSAGGILRAETLRFHDEVRTPEEVGLGEPPKASAAARKRLQSAIASLTADDLDEGELEDPWTEQLESLVARKRKKGEDVVEAPAGEEGADEDVRVIDLLEVLRRSMAEGEAGSRERRRSGGSKGGDTRPTSKEALQALTKEELYARAQELDISGRSGMSKQELVEAIRNAA
jgi:DNA end-binding protein Ku